jgi:hypothetical protein
MKSYRLVVIAAATCVLLSGIIFKGIAVASDDKVFCKIEFENTTDCEVMVEILQIKSGHIFKRVASPHAAMFMEFLLINPESPLLEISAAKDPSKKDPYMCWARSVQPAKTKMTCQHYDKQYRYQIGEKKKDGDSWLTLIPGN